MLCREQNEEVGGRCRGSREITVETIAVFQANNSGCSEEDCSNGKGKDFADVEHILQIQWTGFAGMSNVGMEKRTELENIVILLV